MFTPRNSGRPKRHTSRRHLSSTFSGSSLLITSDAYESSSIILSNQEMKIEGKSTPKSMDFHPFDGCWDDEFPPKTVSTSGQWQFAHFETHSLPPPPPPNPPPKLRLRLPKANRNCFRVGDDDKETRSPLSCISNKDHLTSNKAIKTAETKTTKVNKGKLLSGILHSRVTKNPGLFITTALSTSGTEPISDDDDSLWDDMPSQRGLTKSDLSIRYSKRSEISDGSEMYPASENEIPHRALRPNSTHVNSSFWSDRNRRPYMEDRILLDRVGSTFAPFSSEVKGKISIPALLDKIDRARKNVRRSPVNSDAMPFPQEAVSVYGVFDGHAGSLASQYCSDWFTSYLYENPYFQTDIPRSLVSTFSSIDRDFIMTGNTDGTTACVCVVVGGSRVICANAGDSRAIVVKQNGSHVPLSIDHKPGSQRENQRIRDLGGKVTFNGRWRVEGKLAVSRAIGDFALKPYVTSDPDITDYTIDADDLLLVIASDGIWDVLANEQVATSTISYCCKVKNQELQIDSWNLKYAAKRLCERAREFGSTDNLSVIVVDLQN